MADQPLDYEQCTPDEREVMLDRLLTQRNVLLDEALRVILAADALDDYRADGSLSMADWLAYRCRVSRTTARQWVRAATALEDLPLIRARFVAGDLSFEQVQHALTFAQPADDEHLAALLPALSCAEIELLAKQRRRAQRAEHDEARRLTHLRLRPDPSGTGQQVSGFLANDDAAIVEAALDRRAEAAGPDPETGVWAPHGQRVAGALRDLCAEDLGRAAAEGSEPDAAMVVIHAPAELLDDDTVERQRHHQRRADPRRRAPPGPLRHPRRDPLRHARRPHGGRRPSHPQPARLAPPPGHRPRPPPMSMARLRPGDPPPPPHAALDQGRSHRRRQPHGRLLAPPPPAARRRLERHRQRRPRDPRHQPLRPHAPKPGRPHGGLTLDVPEPLGRRRRGSALPSPGVADTEVGVVLPMWGGTGEAHRHR